MKTNLRIFMPKKKQILFSFLFSFELKLYEGNISSSSPFLETGDKFRICSVFTQVPIVAASNELKFYSSFCTNCANHAPMPYL